MDHPQDQASKTSPSGERQRFERIDYGHLDEFDTLPLPSLDPMRRGRIWFPIFGMFGGFNYEFEVVEGELTLQTESGSRVGGGSFQDHQITASECKLLRDGYM